jgi:hypothetical protein
MERRGFLSFLGLGVAGAMLPDSLQIMPHLFKVEKVAPDLSAVDIKTLTEAVSIEFERFYERQFGNSTFLQMGRGERAGTLVGDRIEEVLMSDQIHCAFEPPEKVEQLRERYINPTAASLASMCMRKELNAFGVLPAPTRFAYGDGSTAIVKTRKSCIRGVLHSYYDLGMDRTFTTARFDVLGGRA